MKILISKGSTRRRRKKRSFRQLFIMLGLLFILSGAVLALRETQILVIEKIVVNGQQKLIAEEVTNAARTDLNTPVFRFFQPNMFLFPEERLSAYLLTRYPRIESVVFKRSLTKQTLTIDIVEREQAGIYCTGNVPAKSQEEAARNLSIIGCYLIDASGVVFAEAPETEGGLILSLIDVTNKEIILGQNALTPDQFRAALELWIMFRTDVSVGISKLIRQDEDVLAIQTFEGWEALFDMTGDTKAQAVALRELLVKELPLQKRTTITTIDLRIPGKIYYR